MLELCKVSKHALRNYQVIWKQLTVPSDLVLWFISIISIIIVILVTVALILSILNREFQFTRTGRCSLINRLKYPLNRLLNVTCKLPPKSQLLLCLLLLFSSCLFFVYCTPFVKTSLSWNYQEGNAS